MCQLKKESVSYVEAKCSCLPSSDVVCLPNGNHPRQAFDKVCLDISEDSTIATLNMIVEFFWPSTPSKQNSLWSTLMQRDL
ncbi:hypothetical protein AAVH_14783 [Aphelenchoides avenae]|nr:hypothetical protein AAVH_14783 [Aphelenchus avenae]